MNNILYLIICLLVLNKSVLINSQTYFQTIFDFIQRGSNDLRLEKSDKNKLLKEYDFIIIGAGTAGCALAARLTENPKWNVLLIEAGQHENLIMDVPILVHFLQLGNINWKYRTQPSKTSCLGMKDNRCNWPRGKVMGGSSVLNYMIYTRGNRRDYDNWANLGNTGWSYNDILPYFKKLEDSNIYNSDYQMAGHGGPVPVSYVNWKSNIAKAFVNAGVENGLNNSDYNGIHQIAISHLQTTTRNSTRTSSNRAYLYPIKGRPNLHITKMSQVTKILINKNTKTAYGVIFLLNNKYYKIIANKEIILSAGAINSPQILMLSGIGPKKHLKNKNIDIIMDLPVGYNLMDHTATAITFTTNASSLHLNNIININYLNDFMNNNGPYGSPGGCESIAFYDLKNPNDPNGWPDIELLMIGGSLSENPALREGFGLKKSIYNNLFSNMENLNSFMILPLVLRPKSRGRIMLKSKNPLKYPLIYSNYFNNNNDIKIAVRGINKTIELLNTKAFNSINAKLWNRKLKNCNNYQYLSTEYWECYVRHITLTIYHYSGTCKMGPKTDTTSVVDPRLRVKGIKNLRVIDASIFPEIIAGHPNGPVYMIAEKGADMIKQDHGFIL